MTELRDWSMVRKIQYCEFVARMKQLVAF